MGKTVSLAFVSEAWAAAQNARASFPETVAFVLGKYLAFLMSPGSNLLLLWWAARMTQTRPLGCTGTVTGPRSVPFKPVVLFVVRRRHASFPSTCASSGWDGLQKTVSQRRTLWRETHQVLPSSAPFLIGVSAPPNAGNFQNKAEYLECLFACQFPECFSNFPSCHSDAFVSLLLGNQWRGRARSGSAQCPGISSG